MPRISFFYGITIWMYWDEREGAHSRPHFHARYAEEAASIDFAGELIAGSLPARSSPMGSPLPRGTHRQLGERARQHERIEQIDPLP